MPPKKVAIDASTVYHSGPSVKQQRFPKRRSSVKPRQSLPAKLEKQSTLTQRWSFSSDVNNSYDEVEEIEDIDDEDFEAAKPSRKRRKTTSSVKHGRRTASERQNTMTQMGFVTSSFGVDGQDDESDRAMDEEEEQVGIHPQEQDSQERVPESVSSMQQVEGPRDEMDNRIDSSSPNPGSGEARLDKEPSAELPYMVNEPRTPRKRFPPGTEIPSSNTPSSALIFAAAGNRASRSPIKSPLEERSMHLSLASGGRGTPGRESPAKTEMGFSPYSASKTDVFRRPLLPASKQPNLIRRSTIPDSEDISVQETQLCRSPVRVQARRRLQRVASTIQDTQLGALGEEINDISYMDDDYPEQSYRDFGGTMENSYPVYDTVAAGLARDAAGYQQTQRLAARRYANRSGLVFDTQEGSDRDLLVAKTQQLSSASGFSFFQDNTYTPNRDIGQSKALDINDGEASDGSQSLPVTPDKPDRARRDSTSREVEIVDLTAESFERGLPTLFGSPTPRMKSQTLVDFDKVVQSPSKRAVDISSSPPVAPSHGTTDLEEESEILPLNDLKPRDGNSHGMRERMHIPPSQVSTVGHLTQAHRSQWQQTQTRVKREVEEEDLYSATLRALKDDCHEIDLDPGLEDVGIDHEISARAEPNVRRIDHVDLSDALGPDQDDDEDYVDIDNVHYATGVPGPAQSSPLPAPPGHEAVEYDYTSRDEISSDLAIHITSPPAESSQAEDSVSPIFRARPAVHLLHGDEVQTTPRASRNPESLTTGLSGDRSGAEDTPRPIQRISDKARGKRPCYRLDDSAHNDELPHMHFDDQVDETAQYSYHFRRADEILPDTQFSIMFPPPPSSADSIQREERGQKAQAQAEAQCKRKRTMQDVSLAAPPKSSYGWRSKTKE